MEKLWPILKFLWYDDNDNDADADDTQVNSRAKKYSFFTWTRINYSAMKLEIQNSSAIANQWSDSHRTSNIVLLPVILL